PDGQIDAFVELRVRGLLHDANRLFDGVALFTVISRHGDFPLFCYSWHLNLPLSPCSAPYRRSSERPLRDPSCSCLPSSPSRPLEFGPRRAFRFSFCSA